MVKRGLWTISALSAALLCVVDAENASPGLASTDLVRAKQRIPRAEWKGDSFASMSAVLTSRLSSSGQQIRPCEQWTAHELKQLLRQLFMESEQELLSVYDEVADNRRQRFKSLGALEAHWDELDAAAAAMGVLNAVRRDGLCHEAVMAAVHHVASSNLKRLATEGLSLPSLPSVRHEPSPEVNVMSAPLRDAHERVHQEYRKQVSCQQCHTGTIADPAWQNATIPGPRDVPNWNTTNPAKDRQRRCNFQMQPPCGPCEGLGGRRWGDGVDEFTPMACEAIHGSEKPATTRGCYPMLGLASITGETRDPLEVFPNGQKGKYPTINATIAMGDEGNVMRLKYDFVGMGGQVSAQSYEQAKNGNVGATFGLFGDQCECSKSIAGNFHACSFEADESLDSINLSASEGGAAYLGRVRVTLDGDVAASQRVAIADHYLKWAFHFLVDAEEGSPSFGLPLRLYGAGGVRMLYDSWKIGDPKVASPDIWTLPKGCNVSAPECSIFESASTSNDLNVEVVV